MYTDVESCQEAPVSEVPMELPLSDGTAPAEQGAASGVGSTAIPASLALTGGGVAPVVPLGAAALILGGVVALVARRRNRPVAQDRA